MKSHFSNDLTASFLLWIDHEILDEGLAYQNISGSLFPTQDNKFAGFKIFASPYSQWVSDASISGANIPTGVFVNNILNGRGNNGLRINFNEGRVLFPNSFNGSNITASYAIKDFNIYLTDEDDESILFKKKYVPKPKTPQELAALPPDNHVFPCIFVKFEESENTPFAFGGQDETENNVRVFVLSDDIFKLDAALSILRDSARKCFPVLQPANLPFNVFGDIKSGSYYNYNNLNGYLSVYIESVKTAKLNEQANNLINPKCLAGWADFKLKSIRYPRL